MALRLAVLAPFRFVSDDLFGVGRVSWLESDDALRAGGVLHVVMQVTRVVEEDGEEEEQEEAGEAAY